MKIDRLIGILAVLQTRGTITAPMLAEKFEVSRRTINRDIEDLCRAGFPIVTMQGAAGGIALMEHEIHMVTNFKLQWRMGTISFARMENNH